MHDEIRRVYFDTCVESSVWRAVRQHSVCDLARAMGFGAASVEIAFGSVPLGNGKQGRMRV